LRSRGVPAGRASVVGPLATAGTAAPSSVVDHDFLDSFSLDIETKVSRYLQLLHDLPTGLSEHPAALMTDGRSVALISTS
jgi:hypothetical protein